MVTEFGHISAFEGTPAQARDLLVYLPAKPQSVQQVIAEALAARGMALKGYQPPPPVKARDGIARKGTYCYGQNGRVASVWNDDFSLWNVEYLTREIATHSPKTLLGAALTDGVFTLVLMKQGECLTRHVAGAANPRIQNTPGDAGLLAGAFGLPAKKEQIAKALQDDNLDEQIDSLEQLFGIKLRLGGADELLRAGWQKIIADGN
jgi:hypothetical protein